MVKKILLFVFAIVVVVAAIVVARAFTGRSLQLPAESCTPLSVDKAKATARLSRALQFQTISSMDPAKNSPEPFRQLHQFIQESFPGLHAKLEREVVNECSLLYTWRGGDAQLPPILLLAHQDVVPADEAAASWTHPPFAGDIADGCVWGRGTLDDKGSLFGILEAVEALVESGYTPARTVYLAFGHDEEIGGANGAAKLAEVLKSRGVKCETSLDEGLAITDGIVPGVSKPIALVAVAEKGYASFELIVKQKGGHSSAPPPQGSIDVLAAALCRINTHPMPVQFGGPLQLMFDYVAPEMRLPFRLLFRNQWLFNPIIKRELVKSPSTNASIRTTFASTIINAGEKDNVMPAMARAVVNGRLMPGDTLEGITDYLRKTIADDRVEVSLLPGAEVASPVAGHDAPGFRAIAKSVRQVRPDVLIAPSLDIGATDSKHYTGLAADQYRFSPFQFTSDELAYLHGVNERVGVDRYMEAIAFYIQFMRNTTGSRE